MSYLHSLNNNFDSQSDDDSIGTLINSPTNSSVSSSSIPWAEENILDNRNEWNKIEKIFYGEEELPMEPKTRNEFLEWMDLFPHLRVVGHKVPIYYDYPGAKEEHFVDEILAIDPPIERYNSRSKSSSRKTNTDDIYFTRRSSKSKEDNLSSDLNKFLKISRSPVMTRRRHLNNSQKSQTNETKVPYFVVPSSSSGKTTLLNRRKFITSISSNAIVPEKESRVPLNASLSASMIRMPQILNFKILNRVPQMCIKSAVYGGDGSRNRNRTILPSIELKQNCNPAASTSSKQRSAGILKN